MPWRCVKCGSTEKYEAGGCKACAKDRAMARYAMKREEILAVGRAKRAAQPKRERPRLSEAELRRRQLVRKRRWEKSNPEKVRAIRRREYQRNRDHYAAYWRTPEGRERNRRYQRQRREGRDVLAVEFGNVLIRDPCSYCNASATGVDHIDALDNGGVNDWTNLTGACARCNSGKRVKPLLLFLIGR